MELVYTTLKEEKCLERWVSLFQFSVFSSNQFKITFYVKKISFLTYLHYLSCKDFVATMRNQSSIYLKLFFVVAWCTILSLHFLIKCFKTVLSPFKISRIIINKEFVKQKQILIFSMSLSFKNLINPLSASVALIQKPVD